MFSHRQTKRNFTAANNAGVTHLEYLAGDAAPNDPSAQQQVLVDTVSRDIHAAAAAAAMTSDTQADISGLVDCYKKVCRVGCVPLFVNATNAHAYTGKGVQHTPRPLSRRARSAAACSVASRVSLSSSHVPPFSTTDYDDTQIVKCVFFLYV